MNIKLPYANEEWAFGALFAVVGLVLVLSYIVLKRKRVI